MHRYLTTLVAALGVALFFLPPAGETAELASLNALGTAAGNGRSESLALSADGRFVVFRSSATDLVPGGSEGTLLFVRNLLTGEVRVASVNDPPYTNGPGLPSMSSDGRFLAYEIYPCNISFFCTPDVFVRDLEQGTTTLVSVGMGGVAVGGSLPMISADGRSVAFTSGASDLVSGDANGTSDIFVRDLDAGITRLASATPAGESGNAASLSASLLSADGRYVAFLSKASDLAPGDGNASNDLFVRDLLAGTTQLVSVNVSGTGSGNGESFGFSLSADGRKVAFTSLASDLVPTDTNQSMDVFVRDLESGVTELVSVNLTETDSGRFDSGRPFLTSNGRYVGFESSANDLVGNDLNSTLDVFLRDLVTGVTKLVSVHEGDAIDWLGSSELPCLYQFCLALQVVSEDGRFVAFVSHAKDLVTGVTYPCELSPCWQVYLRDMVAGVTKLASASPDGSEAGDDSIDGVDFRLSADGRVFVFQHDASNLAHQPDLNDSSDVFVVGAPLTGVTEIPALSEAGLGLLIILLAGLGAWAVRRRALACLPGGEE